MFNRQLPVKNSIGRHRATDEWEVRYDGKRYDVIRRDSPGYPTHWEVIAIRNAPNGGQYNQHLTDESKLKRAIVAWVNLQITIENQHALGTI